MKTKLTVFILVLIGLSITANKGHACGGGGGGGDGGVDYENPHPVLLAVPSTQIPDVNVVLDGETWSHHFPYANIVKYEWDFNDDGTYDYNETFPSSDGKAENRWSNPGDYIVKLRVTDDWGGSGTTLCIVHISGAYNKTQDTWHVTIQAAINDADNNNQIKVYPGIYYENVHFNGVSCALTSTDPNNWDVVAGTIIDANNSGYAVTFNPNEGSGSVLAGFTITNGERGIYCNGASPTISKCIIADNISSNNGGGIYVSDSSPAIKNCFIIGNEANNGGGMYNYNSSPIVSSCVFTQNTADSNGAAVYNYNASPILANCTFNRNDANNFGGGMYSYGSSSEPNVVNCIFWNNDANNAGDEIYNASFADPIFRYCDIKGCKDSNGVWDPNFGTNGGDNIDADPLFIKEMPTGLISHWEFDEGSESVAHDSAGENDGTIYGATWTSGQDGGALNFNGNGNYISLSNQLPDMNSLTISAWVYYTGASTYRVILMDATHSGGNDLVFDMTWNSIGIRADKSSAPLCYEGGGAVSGIWLVDSWHNIIWTMNSIQSKIYVDGTLVTTKNESGSNIGFHAMNPSIGRWWDQYSSRNYFKGIIDDIAVFNRVLSVEEIKQIYRYRYQFTKYYHLAAGSPCINKGDPSGDGQKDIDGEPRVIGAYVDMGADEVLLPTVTVSAGANGTVAPTSVVVNYGANQDFDATPSTGYEVDKWAVDGTDVQTGGATYTLSNITANHTVSVTFKILTYTVTASAGANGSIAPSGAVVVNYGANQAFTATPATNYTVDTWSVDGSVVQTGGTTYTLANITANHTVAVTFKKMTFNLTVTLVADDDGELLQSDVKWQLAGYDSTWRNSGVAVLVNAGNYTIKCQCDLGTHYIAPGDFPITVGQGYPISYTRTYRACGYLTVRGKYPYQCGYSYGSWYVNDGLGWRSGPGQKKVLPGTYTITFGYIGGEYTAPNPISGVIVTKGSVATYDRTYIYNERYVDGDSGLNTNVGTGQCPYKTIQMALNQIPANGQILVCCPATFNESITFPTRTISIWGQYGVDITVKGYHSPFPPPSNITYDGIEFIYGSP